MCLGDEDTIEEMRGLRPAVAPASQDAGGADISLLVTAVAERGRSVVSLARWRTRPAVKLIGAVLIACLAAGATGVWIGGRVKSPAQIAAATAPPPPSTITVTIDERVIADRLSVVGHIRSGKEASVSVLAPDALPIVTSEVVQVGDRIEAGSLLGEIAGRPVFIIEGASPIYRTISPGDTGSDVDQLQRNLIGLGMLDGVTGVFDADTQAAVRALYESHGYAPMVADTDLDSANDSHKLAQIAVADAKKALKSAGEVSALAVTTVAADLSSAQTDLATAKTNADLAIVEAKAQAAAANEALAELTEGAN